MSVLKVATFVKLIFLTVTDLLLDCLELCKSTRMAMDVYHQCQLSDNYGFIAKVSVTLRTFFIQLVELSTMYKLQTGINQNIANLFYNYVFVGFDFGGRKRSIF